METISATPQLLISVNTRKSNSAIPEGKIRITTVQYRTYEYDADELDNAKGSFQIHDASCEEAKTIAKLVAL